jgi:DNA modification methylase
MIHHGDCLDVMATFEPESIDAIVTDPPYGLEFMGKSWDRLGATVEVASEGADVSHPFRDGSRRVRYGSSAKSMQDWHEAWATEAFRIAKPGAHLLAFGGTRTVHRLAAAIEDAGWEIRDMLVWGYASGFPKSLDVSKAIDRAAGAERAIVGERTTGIGTGRGSVAIMGDGTRDITAPATPDAEKWNGWGTALKPAWEPIVMARKPLRGTVAANVLRHGTGALNIDASRLPTTQAERDWMEATARPNQETAGWGSNHGTSMRAPAGFTAPPLGRWPANVILTDPIFDGGIEGVVGGGEANGASSFSRPPQYSGSSYVVGDAPLQPGYGDSGTYSRFFLIPKSARAEREPVLGGLASGFAATMNNGIGGREHDPADPRAYRQNVHPTVKPLDLMRHLVRLVTPPSGTVLDPFLGSGTTALAAEMEGFAWIGIEKEAEYIAISEARLNGTQKGLGLDVGAPMPKLPNTNPDLSKHQPKRRSSSENYSGRWAGTNDPDEPCCDKMEVEHDGSWAYGHEYRPGKRV